MDDLVTEAHEAFELAVEAENENRVAALDDLRFARLGEQWPENVRNQRELENRPALTINRLPTFIRQVVNEARQMKPSIKVHPADSNADSETAEIMNGLIRNIEYASSADVAYDTATESAVTGGFGYFTIDIDYAYDDSFDLDIQINRVANPFSIYGDPNSKAADSSDWNTAFETEWLTTADFERQFPDAEAVDWEADRSAKTGWFRQNEVLIAKWWRRTQEAKKVLLLSDGRVMEAESFDEAAAFLAVEGVTVVDERQVWAHKVKRYILNGKEVLRKEDWPGCYIPIVPVYGDEVNEEGKRHFLSLIRPTKDAQRMYNYWRTAATEMVALAPKVPFIGPKGAFKSDARNWATANTVSHAYLEYDGNQPPQRQPLDSGAAAGALQEAMNAADDIKAILGIFDPSMGAKSNETSGKAIIARERQGDVANFHFQDNMSRAIRHAGRILIDLIPKVYNSERIIRILGEDGTPAIAKLKQPVPQMDEYGRPMTEPVMGPTGQPMVDPSTGTPVQQPVMRIYDLGLGKYDLTVSTGPSFGTQRQEAASQMIEMMRMNPQVAPLIGDLVAKNLDWPGADEIARRLKAMLPPHLQDPDALPPEIQQMIEQGKQQIAQQGQMIQQMQAYILALESDKSNQARKVEVDQFNAETKRLDAETKRIDVLSDMDSGAILNPGADYDARIVAEAQANSLNARADRERANASLATAKTAREMIPPEPPARIIHAHRPRFQIP